MADDPFGLDPGYHGCGPTVEELDKLMCERLKPSGRIKPPWTQEFVDTLNQRQRDSRLHPYTCGGSRSDEKHLDGEVVLVATVGFATQLANSR